MSDPRGKRLNIQNGKTKGKATICLSVNDRGGHGCVAYSLYNILPNRCYFSSTVRSVFSNVFTSCIRSSRRKEQTSIEEGSRSINLEAPGLRFSPPLRLSGPSYKDTFGIGWPEIRSYRYLALTSSFRS